ncbi:TetR/AcrR family transcriptional regulator [Gordonia desulfuricans]|uniref:TetR/AcrR family transcriptional regulator n=1 Tax=Gordonia desulfuricans TaxID=89051 RepID=A0A7K3LLQ0_9ACTN|nr:MULTISPECIES: TetR/AcrR family transcriptional regulator [Gordonia]NDK89182.1 TetR/AcrR family transcriptional regulator [Gordonia desulfuricans]WLP88973.1 TetR/AcrR family transcriptional regulator [Gordonia sp. NB41Y]
MLDTETPPTSTTGRTQAQRSALTREKVLDATVDALIELGYAGTTTQEVNRRAGVSRGALLHQFPTREALVVAAVAHLVDRRKTEILSRPRTGHEDLNILIEVFDGPLFYAALELWVAARTDAALRTAIIPLERRIADELMDTGAALFGDRYTSAELEVAAELARGLAISRLLRDPATDRQFCEHIFTTWTEGRRR